MIQQKVSDVDIAEELLPEVPTKNAVQGILKKLVESCSDFSTPIVPCGYHPLLEASRHAFNSHRPLTLSPDILWLAIAQGISTHVNQNAEELRHKFVDFEGKQEIEVRHDGLIKGVLENPWHEVFDMFSAEIKERIGEENHSNLVVGFSTTGPVEKAANEVVLMDTVKSYFEYSVRTCCGIPEVFLEGTAEDYSKICDRARKALSEYGLSWWAKTLLPTLEGIALCAAGHGDPKLWVDWYNIGGGSGGPFISGHVIQFFPYLKGYEGAFERNPHLEGRGGFSDGIHPDDVSRGLSQVPFTWKYYSTKYPMIFLAGFLGMTQDKETMAVRPKIGWAVMDKEAKNDPNYFDTCGVCGNEHRKELISVREDDPTNKICEHCRREKSYKEGYSSVKGFLPILRYLERNR